MSIQHQTRELKFHLVQIHPREPANNGNSLVMYKVVHRGADARINEIADYGKVRREEKCPIPPPRHRQLIAQIRGCQELQRFFHSQKVLHVCISHQSDSLYRFALAILFPVVSIQSLSWPSLRPLSASHRQAISSRRTRYRPLLCISRRQREPLYYRP